MAIGDGEGGGEPVDERDVGLGVVADGAGAVGGAALEALAKFLLERDR